MWKNYAYVYILLLYGDFSLNSYWKGLKLCEKSKQ